MKKNLKMYCQSDPRWADDVIPGTRLTLKRWGCNLTAVSIGRTRLYPNDPLNPLEVSNMIAFNKNGMIIHKQKYPGFKFIKRFWSYFIGKFEVNLGTEENPNLKWFTLKEWMMSKKSFAVIAVNNNSHFVFAYYWGWLGLYIIDPIDGKVKRLNKHYRPCGYALYHKTK